MRALFTATLLALWVASSGLGAPPAGIKDEIDPTAAPEKGQDAPSGEAQRLSRVAVGEFEHGDLGLARGHFVQALALAPENPVLLTNLALLDYREKKYDAAEAGLKHAIHQKMDSGLAWLTLGVLYHDQDKLDAALAALAQAVLLEPKDARAHLFLGVTIGKKGWYLGAEEELRKAIELQPNYTEAHFNLAVFYLQRTPPAVELARRHYQKALDLGASPDAQLEKSLER